MSDHERDMRDEPTEAVREIREYLRSIGKYALLTAPEELDLGLDVERWMLLKETRVWMAYDLKREPNTAELAAELMMATIERLALLRTLGAESDTEFSPDAPASVLLADPTVRRLLDDPPPDTMKERVADAINVPVENIGRRIALLSRLSAVIPVTTFNLAEDELGLRLYDVVIYDEVARAIEPERKNIERRWRIISDRGQSASERLTSSNLRLVVSVARRYMRRGMPLIDLIQEGNLGLARAVEKYAPHRDNKFSTYATLWIRQAIERALPDQQGRTIQSQVRVSEQIQQLKTAERRLMRDGDRVPSPRELALELDWWPNATIDGEALSSYESEWWPYDKGETLLSEDVKRRAKNLASAEYTHIRERGEYPTDRQLAERLQWKTKAVAQIRRLTENVIKQVETLTRQHSISLGVPVPLGEDFIQDTSVWAPDEIAMNIEMREDVVNALDDVLPSRLRLVLAYRFGLIDGVEYTLEEIGRKLGVTRQRVQQLEKQAIGLLKASGKLPRIEDLEWE